MTQQQRDPLIGREIDGYRIQKLLGHGGMARVYRGYDPNLNRYVAIKVIDPRTSTDPEYRNRFRREAQAVAQLRHQHIVGVHRFGDVDGVYYMAMDYIDGADLRWVLSDYHDEGDLMPLETMLKIIEQIGSALDYSHRQGVIHRDIKPSNIMLDRHGQAILTDFGLVLMSTDGTQGKTFGSPHYISPEQAISSAGAVPQSDLYSLGVVLYEMLTGRIPFAEGTAIQIVMAHMSEPLPPPQTVNPNLHDAFPPILETILAKEPDQRYQSAEKLVKALRTAVRKALKDQPPSGVTTYRLPRVNADAPDLRFSQMSVPDKIEKYRHTNPLPSLKAATATEDTSSEVETVPNKKRGLSRVLIALVIVLITGAAAVFALGGSDLLSDPAVEGYAFAIQGEIRGISGRTVRIYDQSFRVDNNALSLDELKVGDIIRLEGSHQINGSQIRITGITYAEVNNEILVGNDAEVDR